VSVGCFNLLSPTYAVKWDEREGKGPDGSSNWAQRWPLLCNFILRAHWDLVCLQEVEAAEQERIQADLGSGYQSFYFKHEKRPPDGLMIAVRTDVWENAASQEIQHGGVAFGLVDVTHIMTGMRVRIVTAHCRGGREEQLQALADFADAEGKEPDVTVITGDFNEDFTEADGKVRCPFPERRAGSFTTLAREPGLPQVSRPPHKQLPDQKSGKGKIDWIWVRGHRGRCDVELFRDSASRLAILSSHSESAVTGQWPSDHGCEGLSFHMYPPERKLLFASLRQHRRSRQQQAQAASAGGDGGGATEAAL